MTTRHHLDPALVAIVAVGGAVGSAVRYGVSHALPPQHGLPVGTLVENLLGAFLLGALLESLLRAGPEDDRRRKLRLGLGTGVLGGFTTYSALALEVQRLWAGGDVPLAVGYGLGTVVLGFVTATLGIVVGARLGARRERTDGGAE
ncbi:fluoride efflux transporter FluC [Cellulomonas rhizosphaerae]|uniref:Fluoride-specific ion channel FluC n=1 Tax=Cellulomonas rhizosphaerae TaxID=2293719 RepID=A0A413RN93_9CELL|nr:CrcB family protein [Cellulomonas rhizosphaerae]RHA43486.1 CrcB family protein [Cellulomonas rhizosphaerae]